MRSLLKSQDRQAILDRLEALTPDADCKWGRMSVDGMLCHLSDAFRMVLGEAMPPREPKLHERTLMRWVAVSTPIPWPKGVPTAPACDQEKDGTPPTDFDLDRASVLHHMERFLTGIREDRLFHPLFGAMSAAEWGRWGYRHLDHHLRQFSA